MKSKNLDSKPSIKNSSSSKVKKYFSLEKENKEYYNGWPPIALAARKINSIEQPTIGNIINFSVIDSMRTKNRINTNIKGIKG